MKKSQLNIGLSIALSGAIMSGSILPTQAYAGEFSDISPAHADAENKQSSENYMFPGIGAGAAAGTLIAGPVGFVIGGLIGGFVGSSQDDVDTGTENTVASNSELSADESLTDVQLTQSKAETSDNFLADESTELPGIQVAQLGNNSIPESNSHSAETEIINIMANDFSLDIYFRSGSTDIESFYPARLDAIARLMERMNQLEINLDGYTDRRGNKTQNIKLANLRLENVRQQLINAGVDENRIISKAHGEIKMVSSPGDLEAYTFDRKVVISFARSDADSINTMTSTLSASDSEDLIISDSDEDKTTAVAKTSTTF